MITTNSEVLNERLQQLRNDGQSAKYRHDIIGHNERLDAIQAAILSIKLPYLDKWNKQRQMIANMYTAAVKDKELPVSVPKIQDKVSHVFHQYVISLDNRDKIREILWKDYQIGTGVHYPIPVHKQLAYKEFNQLKLPKAEYMADRILSLPMYPELSLIEALEVIGKLEAAIKKAQL